MQHPCLLGASAALLSCAGITPRQSRTPIKLVVVRQCIDAQNSESYADESAQSGVACLCEQ